MGIGAEVLNFLRSLLKYIDHKVYFLSYPVQYYCRINTFTSVWRLYNRDVFEMGNIFSFHLLYIGC